MKKLTKKKQGTALGRGVRYFRVIIESLLFVLPLLVIYYLFFSYRSSFDTSQLLIIALTLALVLSGVLILRKIFERFEDIAAALEDTGRRRKEGANDEANTRDLKKITISFRNLMKQFEKTTRDLKRRVFELFTIRDMAETASKTLETDLLLDALLERSMDISGAEIGTVFSYDPETSRLKVVAHQGLPDGPSRGTHIRLQRSLLAQVVKEGRPMLVEDIETDPRTLKPNGDRYGTPSFLAMPIIIREGVVAVISLSKKETGQIFDSDDEQVLSILIREIGFAIENIRLHSKVERSFRAFEASEERYRSILQTIGYGYYETDLEGNFTFFSDGLLDILSRSGHELRKLSLYRLFGSEEEERVRKVAEIVMDSGEASSPLEITFSSSGTAARTIEMSLFLLRGRQDRPTGFRGVARDITLQIEAERQRKELASRVKDIQRLEALGTLAGGIAHNFNNLLMGIQGNVTMAQLHVEENGPAAEKLENMERLIQNGALLTGQLLGYAREGKYEPAPLNINRLTSDLTQTFKAACKGIQFSLKLTDGSLAVSADRNQLEQVLTNLLLNAKEAMPDTGRIEISTTVVKGEDIPRGDGSPRRGGYVCLRIVDTGTGMDSHTLERAFEPFYTTKDENRQGRGMGLASVYGIVKAHEGAIDLSSAEGRGTTATVYLPLLEGVALEKKKTKKRIVAGYEPKAMGRRILMVDDQPMILETGAAMLERLGYQADGAEGGQAAIDKLTEKPEGYDLVILDMIMPGMNGERTFAKIMEINPGIPVLLCSGYSRDQQADAILDRGARGYLQKPFNLEQLSRAVIQATEKEPASKKSSEQSIPDMPDFSASP